MAISKKLPGQNLQESRSLRGKQTGGHFYPDSGRSELIFDGLTREVKQIRAQNPPK